MKKHLAKALLILMVLVLAGCSKAEEPAPLAQPTEAPIVIEITEAVETEMPIPMTGEEIITEVVTEALIETPVVITHLEIPGESTYKSDQRISDCNTGERKAMGVSRLIAVDCDIWDKDKIERPADQNNGIYYPVVDIVSAQMGDNTTWYFGKINLFESAAGLLPADLTVAIEIDLNLDSRGDYLIRASGLNSTDWTTDGVQVWRDLNGDVGGSVPHRPDGDSVDGYETLLFDSGIGDDSDLAWVRINPDNGAVVEFAFKNSLLGGNKVFAWWVRTELGEPDPVNMEIVDLKNNETDWLMDNSCGWIYNSKPSRMLVNSCEFFVPTATPQPTPTPQPNAEPQCPPGYYWGYYWPADKWMCLDIDPN